MGQPTETHGPLGEDREVRSQERENVSFDDWTGVGEILRREATKSWRKGPQGWLVLSLQGIGEQNAE